MSAQVSWVPCLAGGEETRATIMKDRLEQLKAVSIAPPPHTHWISHPEDLEGDPGGRRTWLLSMEIPFNSCGLYFWVNIHKVRHREFIDPEREKRPVPSKSSWIYLYRVILYLFLGRSRMKGRYLSVG